jgi:hypothetical protein
MTRFARSKTRCLITRYWESRFPAAVCKLRFGDPSRGKGKRGGVRVIYLHTREAARVDLITVYGKDERDDLSKQELEVLCRHARRLRDEAIKQAAGSGR